MASYNQINYSIHFIALGLDNKEHEYELHRNAKSFGIQITDGEINDKLAQEILKVGTDINDVMNKLSNLKLKIIPEGSFPRALFSDKVNANTQAEAKESVMPKAVQRELSAEIEIKQGLFDIRSHREQALKNMQPLYKNMLGELEVMKNLLHKNDPVMSNKAYANIKGFIESMVIMQAFRDEISKLADMQVAHYVTNLIGIGVHPEQLKGKKIFFQYLDSAQKLISDTYTSISDPKEKLRFFKQHGLSHASCLDEHFTSINENFSLFNTLFSKLSYQIENFRDATRKSFPIKINDLLPWLREVGFFKENNITEEQMLISDDLKRLEIRGFVEIIPQPLYSIDERFLDALMFSYSPRHQGLEKFKECVLKNVELTDEERKNIDEILKKYFAGCTQGERDLL